MSQLFDKILIATDGSKYSQPAVKKGLEIARLHHAKVFVLYVIDTRALMTTTGAPPPENIYRILEQEGKEAVALVAGKAGDVEVEPVVLTGPPSSTIVRYANEHGVSLIVMGTLGKSGIEHLLLGSVAHRVIRHATCPVLVVRP